MNVNLVNIILENISYKYLMYFWYWEQYFSSNLYIYIYALCIDKMLIIMANYQIQYAKYSVYWYSN